MRQLLALALALLLGACGLQPMYAGGAGGGVAQGLAAVEVSPIEGKAGWLMRNALNDRLSAPIEAKLLSSNARSVLEREDLIRGRARRR